MRKWDPDCMDDVAMMKSDSPRHSSSGGAPARDDLSLYLDSIPSFPGTLNVMMASTMI